MVLPLLPYIATALAGVAGGALASGALSGSGETANTGGYTDARALSVQYPSYQIQIDSPLASQSTTKKASATTEAEASTGGTSIDASSLIPIALIVGGAIVIKEMLK
jgi:hypothetical protein